MLHDAYGADTGRGGRSSAVKALPVALVVGLLIPGSLAIRLMAVLGGVFVAMIYALVFVDEAVEHRSV